MAGILVTTQLFSPQLGGEQARRSSTSSPWPPCWRRGVRIVCSWRLGIEISELENFDELRVKLRPSGARNRQENHLV